MWAQDWIIPAQAAVTHLWETEYKHWVIEQQPVAQPEVFSHDNGDFYSNSFRSLTPGTPTSAASRRIYKVACSGGHMMMTCLQLIQWRIGLQNLKECNSPALHAWLLTICQLLL
jgi:hypothetical protein